MRDFIDFNCIRQPRIRGYEIWAVINTSQEKRVISEVTIETMLLNEYEEKYGGMYMPAPIELSEESAQALMDALWGAGVKPSGGEGHTAHIRALNKHLDDMRKLVFHKEGIE